MTVHSISFEQDAIDQRHLRHALSRFATGVTVVTTRTTHGKLEALTANSFSAVSLDPPLVLWSLGRNSPSLPSFLDSGYFAVNVLAADQCDLSRHFAMRAENKFANLTYAAGLGGCPLLSDTLAELPMQHGKYSRWRRPHHFHRAEFTRATYRDGEPLIFSAGQYCTHTLLGGAADQWS